MEQKSIYKSLKEATAMADVIEASESGYIALNDDSILDLKMMLLDMLHEVTEKQEAIVKRAKKDPAVLQHRKAVTVVQVE